MKDKDMIQKAYEDELGELFGPFYRDARGLVKNGQILRGEEAIKEAFTNYKDNHLILRKLRDIVFAEVGDNEYKKDKDVIHKAYATQLGILFVQFSQSVRTLQEHGQNINEEKAIKDNFEDFKARYILLRRVHDLASSEVE
jgi:hypothetical protein